MAISWEGTCHSPYHAVSRHIGCDWSDANCSKILAAEMSHWYYWYNISAFSQQKRHANRPSYAAMGLNLRNEFISGDSLLRGRRCWFFVLHWSHLKEILFFFFDIRVFNSYLFVTWSGVSLSICSTKSQWGWLQLIIPSDYDVDIYIELWILFRKLHYMTK